MYAELNACVRKSWVHVCGIWVHVCGNGWVQSMRLLGAKYAENIGCMYAVVGCKSMERLGAA